MNKAAFQLDAAAILGIVNHVQEKHEEKDLCGIIMTALNVLLHRYTGQDDIFTGNFVLHNANPNHQQDTYQLTPFQNTITGEETFTQILKPIHNVTNKFLQTPAFAFVKNGSGLPNEIINEIGKIGGFAITVYNSADIKAHNPLQVYTSNADICFVFTQHAGYFNACINYNSAIYQAHTVATIAGHFMQLLLSIKANPYHKIGAFNILTPAEKEAIVVNFNHTVTPYSKHKTMMGLFEEQVLKTPNNIALKQDDRVMTYAELNKRSNQIAHYIRTLGISNGDSVAIIAERGFDMIVGMYAILKAGGAYVPIEPGYPEQRQQYIITNSSVKITIADSDYSIKNVLPQGSYININNVSVDEFSDNNPHNNVSSTQLAYTIYTSGSTGMPKGVMIAHHSAVNLIEWVNKRFAVGEHDCLLFITSMCFDLSVYDIFGMLATGGSLVIVRNTELLDANRMQHLLKEHNITFWDSVPTTMDYLVNELEHAEKNYVQQSLRVVFMSGDWISVNLPNRIKNYFPNADVISLGGATEGTVWSNYYPIEKVESHWKSIPYGRPMNNNYFYILNEQLQPVPVGVVGELYIGGAGVAEGYANDVQKTAYSFIEDPFNKDNGGRMYRTGDLGKMGADLNMIFIGRKDNQVKINGFRVELGEIESAINKSGFAFSSVVIAKATGDNKKMLVGYVVPKPGYSRDKVTAYLKMQLPNYMVPAAWLELDALPVTANGKIDRKKLAALQPEERQTADVVTPTTPLQKELVNIWKNILKLDNIGLTASFFDLGGHSLLAVQLMSRVEKTTGKKFPISILFQHPTIESLSKHIEKHAAGKSGKLTSLVPIKPSGNKVPLYIVHGVGLNVLNFKSLAEYISPSQPLFGFQAKGLDGVEQPLDEMKAIAKHYVSELLIHNPTGPYAIGGYSFGGFIAMEMARQLEELGRTVQFLAIFDTDADYSKKGSRVLPDSFNINGIKHFAKTFSNYPSQTLNNIKRHFKDPENPYDQLVLSLKSDSDAYYMHMKRIRIKLENAFDSFKMAPFNGTIHLFKAEFCIHFTKDKQYLGWQKYATQGVLPVTVPGDHTTIFSDTNVPVLGKALQTALDNTFSLTTTLKYNHA